MVDNKKCIHEFSIILFKGIAPTEESERKFAESPTEMICQKMKGEF